MKSWVYSRRAIRTLAAAVILTLGAASIQHAVAAQVTNTLEEVAIAFFSSTDLSGCVDTGAVVFVSLPWFLVGIAQTDYCAAITGGFCEFPDECTDGDDLTIDECEDGVCTHTPRTMAALGRGVLAAGGLTIRGDLRSAALSATVELEDFVSGSSFNVILDVDWMATSRLRVRNTASVDRFPSADYCLFSSCPDLIFVTHEASSGREARAVGSISDGVTNFAPLPTDDSHLRRFRSGSVTVQLGPPCRSDAECDDGYACSLDTCDLSGAVGAPVCKYELEFNDCSVVPVSCCEGD